MLTVLLAVSLFQRVEAQDAPIACTKVESAKLAYGNQEGAEMIAKAALFKCENEWTKFRKHLEAMEAADEIIGRRGPDMLDRRSAERRFDDARDKAVGESVIAIIESRQQQR